MTDDPGGDAATTLAAQLEGDLASLDSELAEIDMLIAQVRTEAERHEQKRAQAAEKLSAAGRALARRPGGGVRHARHA